MSTGDSLHIPGDTMYCSSSVQLLQSMDLDVHEYRLCLSAIFKPDQGLGELTYGKSRFVYKYSCHVNLLPALSGGALTIEQNDGRR